MKKVGRYFLLFVLLNVGWSKVVKEESSDAVRATDQPVGKTSNGMTDGSLSRSSERPPLSLSLNSHRELKSKNIFTSKMSGKMMGIMTEKKHKKTMSHTKKNYKKSFPKNMKMSQQSMMKPNYTFKGRKKKYLMPAPPPFPPRRPGDRSPPVSPTHRSRNQPSIVVSTNLVLGTASDPFVDFVVLEQGLQASVDLTVPDRVDQLYLVRERDVEPGSPCPPAGGLAISLRDSSAVRVPLYSRDSVIAFCVDGSVVSQAYYMFESVVSIIGNSGRTEFPNSFVKSVDFSLASVSSPVTVSFPFGPGLDLDGFGTIVLYDTRRRRSDEFERRLNVDSYYVAPNGESVRTGEACPIPFSEFLPSDDKFPLTLYALEGTEDQTVYACSGSTIVGVADFSYVANSVDTPSLSPTVPSPAPSSLAPNAVGSTVTPATQSPTIMPTNPPTQSPSQRAGSNIPTLRTESPSAFNLPSESPSMNVSSSPTGNLSNNPTIKDSVSNAPSKTVVSSLDPSLSPTTSFSVMPTTSDAVQSQSPSNMSGSPSSLPVTAESNAPTMTDAAQSLSPTILSRISSVSPSSIGSNTPTMSDVVQSQSPSALSESPSGTPVTASSNAPTMSDATQTENPSVTSASPSVRPSTLPSTADSNAPSLSDIQTESPSAILSDFPTGPDVGIVYGLQPNCAIIDDTRFNICLDISSASGEVEGWFSLMVEAAKRWERIISGDPWGPWDPSSYNNLNLKFVATQRPTDTIDDIYVAVLVGPIDGSDGRFAEAGPDLLKYLPDGTTQILAASIKIDEADLQKVLNKEIFGDLMLHELGHALGLGSLWQSGVHTSGAEYVGEKAVLAWRDIGCMGPLPLASLDDRSHWNEDCLQNEVMTPYLLFGSSVKVSSITMGALEDLGYSVNRAEEDSFGLGDLGSCADFCPASARRLRRRHRKMLRSRGDSTDAAPPAESLPSLASPPLSDGAESSLLEAAATRFRRRLEPQTEQVRAATHGTITDGTSVSYLYQENGYFISRTIHRSQVEHLIR